MPRQTFTIFEQKTGKTHDVVADSLEEAYQKVFGRPLVRATPTPADTGAAPAPTPTPVPAPVPGTQEVAGGREITPEEMREALLALLPIIGGMAAPLIGPQFALPSMGPRVAQLVSGLAKAGMGGAAGESVANVVRALAGSEEAPRTVPEAAERALEAGTRQAAEEALGAGVVPFVRGAYKAGGHLAAHAFGGRLPYATRVTDLGREVIETTMRESSQYQPVLSDVAKQMGLRPEAVSRLPLVRASQVTVSKTLDIITRISESAPLSGFETAVRNFTREGAGRIVQQIADELGAHAQPNELGQALLLSNQRIVEAHKLVENKMWRHLLEEAANVVVGTKPRFRMGEGGKLVRVGDAPIKGVRVPTKSLAKLVEGLRRVEKEIQRIGRATDAGAIADSVDAMVRAASRRGAEPSISFEAAKVLRSRLSAEIDRVQTLVGGPAPARGTLTRLRKQLDGEMRAALQAQAPHLVKVFDTANRLTRVRAQRLQNSLVEELTKRVDKYTEAGVPVFEGPLGEVPATILSGPGAAGKVEQIRKAVSPEEFDKLANSWVQWTLAGESRAAPRLYDGEALRHAFSPDGPNGELLNALFRTRPEQLARLRRWINVLAATQLKPGEGAQIGTIAIMQTQWSAIGALTAYFLTGSAGMSAGIGASFIITPPLLSRMINSPLGYQLLTRAVSVPPGTREATILATKIVHQAEELKKGMDAVERAYSDNVEMQIRDQLTAAPWAMGGNTPRPIAGIPLPAGTPAPTEAVPASP